MLLSRHRNSEGSVEMSDESESETDSSLADDECSGQFRRRSSTTSKKRRWLKEEVKLLLTFVTFLFPVQYAYMPHLILCTYCAPDHREGAVSIAFVCPSIRLSVCASVRRIGSEFENPKA